MILKIFYIDTEKNLLLLEREITDKEESQRQIEVSFSHKALILAYPIIANDSVWNFESQKTDYERFLNNYGIQMLDSLQIPISAFREENKIFYLDF